MCNTHVLEGYLGPSSYHPVRLYYVLQEVAAGFVGTGGVLKVISKVEAARSREVVTRYT